MFKKFTLENIITLSIKKSEIQKKGIFVYYMYLQRQYLYSHY